MEITLDRNSADFVRHSVASGRFNDAAEMVGLALDLLKDPQKSSRFKALQSALKEGLDQADRGELVSLDLPELIQEIRTEAANP